MSTVDKPHRLLNNNGGWYAKEYLHHINVYDQNCVFYMRLYKKSTPDAVEKARHIVDVMNTVIGAAGYKDRNIELEQVNQSLQDRNRNLKKQLDSCEQSRSDMKESGKDMLDELNERRKEQRKLEIEAGRYKRDAHNLARELNLLENVVENQSAALRNISTQLEK